MPTKGPENELWMRPKNWREYQHYHDGRRNYFVKNYLALDDPGSKFRTLSWADQGRLQALWRLAMRLEKDGMIPYDERYLRAVLGDKRFTLATQMVTTWFHIGTQTELKKAANREKRSSRLRQDASPRSKEVRSKKPQTPSHDQQVKTTLRVVDTCPECLIGGGHHTTDCTRKDHAA